MANAEIDQNGRQTLTAVSSADGVSIVQLWGDPITHRLLTSAVSTANLIIGTSTITNGTNGLLLYDNNGVVGELATSTYPSLTELSYVKGVTSAIQTQLNSKGAGTVTAVSVASANGISGSSSGGATPALTIALGAITPTTVNGNTFTTGTYTLTGQAGKTLTFNGSITLTGIDAQTYTFPSSSDTVVTLAATQTLTNKRITPRVLSATAYTTDTGSSINGDTQDMFIVTAQTGALKFNNPSGTPTDGQKFIISVASSTTSARALTWDTAYGSTTTTLPTTTAATTATLTIGFIWSASKSLWQCVAVS